MAIPVATGMVLAAERKSTGQIKVTLVEEGGRDQRNGPVTVTAHMMAPAKANHLICWRSSARDRRKRTIRETAPTAVSASVRYNPTDESALSRAPTCSMPKGLATLRLATLRLEVSIGPGLKDPTKSSTAAIRSSHSTALQRCEGGRPSGKSSKRRANIVMMMGPLRNASSQAAVPPPGSEPGLLTTA